jgi:hypothetical protein
MKLALKKGEVDVSLVIFIQDSSSTVGAGLTGLVYNSASLVCYYCRPGSAAAQLTLATQTVTGAHSDGGFVEIDSTNMPGAYRLDLSDTIVSSGVDSVVVMLKGATNMAPCVLEIQLTDMDLNDGVRGALTALPNAAAEAAGGLFTRGTGAGQINQDANGRVDVNVEAWDAGAVPAPAQTGVPKTDPTYLAGVSQSLLDLKDFADEGYDPSTNKVQGVVLVDTTTTNTDMRGTDNALLAASAPTNFGDLAITVTTGLVSVGTNNDKTGYSISGTKTTLDALNDLAQSDILSDATPFAGGNIDAAITSRSSHSAADVWSVGTRSITGLTAAALADFFDTDSGTTYGAAVSGSVVKEIADNAGGSSGLTALASGTAQSGTSSTIVLAAASSFADNVLNGNIIKITGGTGAGQARIIISNTLADDTCNIYPNWTTNPSSDSVYEIVEGTVNIGAVSLDGAAADNLELDYDGTGYDKANSTIGTCTTNTDMRGTDSALLASSAPTNFGDLAITVTTGYVTVGTNNDKTGYDLNADQSAVTIGTVTTNTDMRGTDNALLAASAPSNFSDLSITASTGRVDVGSWLGTAVTVSSTTSKPEVDMYSISDDAAAANNLETAADGGSYNLGGGAVVAASVTGAVGSVTGAVGSVTGNVGGNVTGSVGSLGATAKSDVNAEVVDALATDTYAEPGQGAPGATVSLSAKIGYLYKAWRNKKDNDGTTTQLYADDGSTVDQKQTTSESGGTVTKAEWVSGP